MIGALGLPSRVRTWHANTSLWLLPSRGGAPEPARRHAAVSTFRPAVPRRPNGLEDPQGWRCGAQDEHRRFPDLDRQASQARALAVASAPAADGLPRLVAPPGPRTATRRIPIERLHTGAYCSFCPERPLESAGAARAEQIGCPPEAFPELTVTGWPGYGPITTTLHGQVPGAGQLSSHRVVPGVRAKRDGIRHHAANTGGPCLAAVAVGAVADIRAIAVTVAWRVPGDDERHRRGSLDGYRG